MTQVVRISRVDDRYFVSGFVLYQIAVVGPGEGHDSDPDVFEIEDKVVEVGMFQALVTAQTAVVAVVGHAIVQPLAQTTVVDVVEAAEALTNDHLLGD